MEASLGKLHGFAAYVDNSKLNIIIDNNRFADFSSQIEHLGEIPFFLSVSCSLAR